MRFRYTFLAFSCLSLLSACSSTTPRDITPKTQIAFTDSGQRVGNPDSSNVTLGDLDNDGDLDILLDGQIYLNEKGVFTAGDQNLGSYFNTTLGDIDGDSDIDLILTHTESQAEIYLNEDGTFVDSGQRLGSIETDFGSTATAWGVALGDIDGDGDLDAYAANHLGVPDHVYFNENGTFTDSGQRLGRDGGMDAALEDLDGDGDLDAFVMSYGGAQIYFNEGGTFTDSEQWLDDYDDSDVELRDLDGDSDLDVIIAGAIYLNEEGFFTKSAQRLGERAVDLGDLDGDGDMDAFVESNLGAHNVYFNEDGTFTKGTQSIVIGNAYISDLALGDLDGDGDLDAFITSYRSNRIYFNEEVEVN